MLIKWKINSSRWLWQSIIGESKNFWSITIPALFESSAERLITLLETSSRTKAFVTMPRNIVLIKRFFRPPVESIPMYALFGSPDKRSWSQEFQFFLYDTCTQPSGRTHSLLSYSEWSSQYYQEIFWHLIAQYFRLLYYVWSFDRLIDAIYHNFTWLMIFNIFWSSPWQILKRAHHSSGNGGQTSSPLDHSAVSLSKQTDIVHSEGCQLHSCDIVRYTDQCCIGLKGQSEFSTIGDLLMLPRAFKNLGLQKLRFAFI